MRQWDFASQQLREFRVPLSQQCLSTTTGASGQGSPCGVLGWKAEQELLPHGLDSCGCWGQSVWELQGWQDGVLLSRYVCAIKVGDTAPRTLAKTKQQNKMERG